ncbi:MAG TPA: hypothetical protein VMZ92_16530 [Planctomycetota bacterium]|nr:hypothetical protein [Planctomycetota bacterium]
MIPTVLEAQCESVDGILKKCASSVRRVGPGQWRVTFANGRTVRADASIEDEEWLVMDALLQRAPKGSTIAHEKLWQLLLWNAEIDGAAKFVLGPREGAVRLRAEIPLEGAGAVPAAEIEQACRDFRTSFARFKGQRGRKRPAKSSAEPASGEDDSGCNLTELCRNVGWPFTERASGKLSIPLGSDGSYQAILSRRESGRVRASVDLGRCEDASKTSREALGWLLLGASGVLRMVRASAEEADGAPTVLRLEAALEACPDAARVVHALSALEVGCCWLCGREVQVLLDHEDIAREYLSARGRVPEPR